MGHPYRSRIRFLSLCVPIVVLSMLPVAAQLVDHACVEDPVFPDDCVEQLGPIGNAPTQSTEEGFLNIVSPVERPLLVLRSANANAGRLYALNPLGNRVRVIDPSDMSVLQDIRVCYRPSSLAQTADGSELLVSCHASHAVGVIDTARNKLVAEIQDRDDDGRPLLQEPMGIAVHGSTAYVASSQNHSVAVLDLTSRRVERYIRVPGQDPRSLTVTPDGKFIIVANFTSGNRTEPNMLPNLSILNPEHFAGQTCAPLLVDAEGGLIAENVAIIDENDPNFMNTAHPDFAVLAECYHFAHTFGGSNAIVVSPHRTDHDVVVLDAVSGDVVFTTNSLAQDVGTLNYGVTYDAGQRKVYLATVHARNALGHEFGNRPLINRLVTLDFDSQSGVLSLPANGIRDLDDPFLDDAGVGTSLAATPFAVALRDDALVIAAAGSDHLLLADPSGVVNKTLPVGFTPKGVVIHGNHAYAYNSTGLSISKVSIDPDAGADAETQTASIGNNGLSQPARIGAHLMNSAQFASNGTFACASCHPDGHLDGLVWELNEIDGMRSTMTLQEITETAPYHWDGAKCNLVKILQDGIVNLFQNPAGPSSCEMKTMIDFMDSLVRPHTPYRAPDDAMTDSARLGLAIVANGRSKHLNDQPRACNGRPRDPAVESKYLPAIGDPFNELFDFNGGGGPVPNTLVNETCSTAGCHVTPHWESTGTVGNIQAVSMAGTWDRMVTFHDAHTTRAKFIEALEINRTYHGAESVNSGDNYTGELASHAFADTHFRHPEFNFDSNPETHAFTLTDGLTQFMMEEEELQTGSVGLSVVVSRPPVNEADNDRLVALLETAADQGKIVLRGVGTLGGNFTTLVWDPVAEQFETEGLDQLPSEATGIPLSGLRDSMIVGDTMLLYGALPPGQGANPNPKLKAVSRDTAPILCAEAYANYHASVEIGETDVALVLHGIDAVAGSRVLINGEVVGEPLVGSGPDFTWTLPAGYEEPALLSLQVMNAQGMQSNAIPLPVLDPVLAAAEPNPLSAVAATPGELQLDWPSQFGITGPGTRYDVFRGGLGELSTIGFKGGTCFAGGLTAPAVDDGEKPESGQGFYYVARAQNQVNVTTWGGELRDAEINDSDNPCLVLFP